MPLSALLHTISKKIDLSSIPEEYYKYTDIFSKSKAETLAPHYPYNLQIELEKDFYPSVETIYSLFQFEQEMLKEFIDKNLTNRFIRSMSSPYRVLVLLIKKKMDPSGSVYISTDLTKSWKKTNIHFPSSPTS